MLTALLAVFSLIVPNARAAVCHDGSVGIDVDGDGWCTTDTPVSDCDDNLGGGGHQPR